MHKIKMTTEERLLADINSNRNDGEEYRSIDEIVNDDALQQIQYCNGDELDDADMIGRKLTSCSGRHYLDDCLLVKEWTPKGWIILALC